MGLLATFTDWQALTPSMPRQASSLLRSNDAVVGRWLYGVLWRKTYCPAVLGELNKAPDMLLSYSLHEASGTPRWWSNC